MAAAHRVGCARRSAASQATCGDPVPQSTAVQFASSTTMCHDPTSNAYQPSAAEPTPDPKYAK